MAQSASSKVLGPRWAAVVVSLLVFIKAPALAQNSTAGPPGVAVEETRWGFDGKTTARTFTPLSVLVQNHEASPVSGQLRLRRLSGFDKQVEVPLVIDYDIPPFEQRWLQFVPYVIDEYDSWFISWGDGKNERVEVPAPRIAERAVVLLSNPDELLRRVGTIRRFPANLFPPSITATDALDAIVLDSVPDLQGARLQALLDWLNAGGRVFLLHDDTERYPRFPESLSAFNATSDQFPVGAGKVRRLPIRAADIDSKLLTETLMSLSLETPSPDRNDDLLIYGHRRSWERDDPILSDLETTARFTRRWWLIYPIALLYLASVYPGSYLVGRNFKPMRWFYAMFLGSVVTFSLIFITLGKVGGGVQNRIRSASIARQISPGLYDVNQWSVLAAVTGDQYVAHHSGSGRCYSTAGQLEAIGGTAFMGPDAHLELDIPPASTRSVVSRQRCSGPDLKLAVGSVEIRDGRLGELSLDATSIPGELLKAYVGYGSQLYKLQEVRQSLIAETLRPAQIASFVASLDEFQAVSILGWRRDEEKHEPTDDVFRRLDRRLIGNAFSTRNRLDRDSMKVPGGVLRIFLLVRDDETFMIESDEFPDRSGCVLYTVDLPVSGD